MITSSSIYDRTGAGEWTTVADAAQEERESGTFAWIDVTDPVADDFDRIAGKRDQLVGKLQEKYGWARQDAEAEVARRFRDLDEAAQPTYPSGTNRP